MGRLTLNMLLCFAQLEREVTVERIRDKIVASEREGLWTGVQVPFGYDACGRTLRIGEETRFGPASPPRPVSPRPSQVSSKLASPTAPKYSATFALRPTSAAGPRGAGTVAAPPLDNSFALDARTVPGFSGPGSLPAPNSVINAKIHVIGRQASCRA